MIGNRRMLRYQDFSSVPRAPARSAPPAQLAQQLVEPVEQAGPFGGEVIAAFGQQPQDHRLVFGGDDAQTAVLVQGDLGDGVRVVGSVLPPPPVASSRTRVARVAGTSSTCSPVAVSCWAMPRPRPCAPSTANCRCGQPAAHVSRAPRVPALTANLRARSRRPVGSRAAAVSEDLCGSIPIVITAGELRMLGDGEFAAVGTLT